MWGRLTHACGAGLISSLIATAAIAGELQSEITAAITLKEAIAQSLAQNPELLADGLQVQYEQAALRQADLAPNPELSVGVENLAGSGRFSGIDAAETTISIAWILERGKRSKRVDYAMAGISLAETEQRIRRLDVAAETARLYLDCLSFDAQLKQAGDAIDLTRATLSTVTKRVSAGRSPAADALRAQTDLARAELVYEDLQHQQLVAFHRLAAQWGAQRPDFQTVRGTLTHLPDPGQFDALLNRLRATPDQQRFFSEQRLRESELRLAQSRARPSWELSTGIRRFEFSDDHAFVAELKVPLAMRNRNQGNIAAARTALEQTSARQQAALIRQQTELFAMYQELLHNRHVAETFNNNILPKLEQALAETERAYDAGRYSFYELSIARADLLAARKNAVAAAVGYLRHVIELERLTGVSLNSLLITAGDAS